MEQRYPHHQASSSSSAAEPNNNNNNRQRQQQQPRQQHQQHARHPPDPGDNVVVVDTNKNEQPEKSKSEHYSSSSLTWMNDENDDVDQQQGVEEKGIHTNGSSSCISSNQKEDQPSPPTTTTTNTTTTYTTLSAADAAAAAVLSLPPSSPPPPRAAAAAAALLPSSSSSSPPPPPSLPSRAVIEANNNNIVRPGAYAMYFDADAVSLPLRDDVETGTFVRTTAGTDNDDDDFDRHIPELDTNNEQRQRQQQQEPTNNSTEELRLEWQRLQQLQEQHRLIQNQNQIIEQQERRMQQLEESAQRMRALEQCMLHVPILAATRVTTRPARPNVDDEDEVHVEVGVDNDDEEDAFVTTAVPSHHPMAHSPRQVSPSRPPIVVAAEIVPEWEGNHPRNKFFCCFCYDNEWSNDDADNNDDERTKRLRRRWKIAIVILGLLLLLIAVIAAVSALVGGGSGSGDDDNDKVPDAKEPALPPETTMAPTVVVVATPPDSTTESPTTASWPSQTREPTPLPDDELPSAALSGFLETIMVDNVGASWRTVVLSKMFEAPIPVCSVNYGASSVPLVVRMQQVKPNSNSFEIRLQNPGDREAVPSKTVNCLVVEKGKWRMPDGRLMEATSYASTITDHLDSWIGQVQKYSNDVYQYPVVVGQVISSNDPRWSVFWCSFPNARADPPSATGLATGKHVAGDTVQTRATEIIGVIVMEAGRGENYEASIGQDTVGDFSSNTAGYGYRYYTAFATVPKVQIVSQVGMNGPDGSWAVLTQGQTVTTLKVATDEDQISDTERSHMAEQVAYIVFEKEEAFALANVEATPPPLATTMPPATTSSPAVRPTTAVPKTETPAQVPPTEAQQTPIPLTQSPTDSLTTSPMEEPTIEPVPEMPLEPTAEPTTKLTPVPTQEPTTEPTPGPTLAPELIQEPTSEPTLGPTLAPQPTLEPTIEPTPGPTPQQSIPGTTPTQGSTPTPVTVPPTEPSVMPSTPPPPINISWNLLGQPLSGENADDRFGAALALSANGMRVAVGAYTSDEPNGTRFNAGHVRVYDYNERRGIWNSVGKALHGDNASDQFGRSVALSADGSILAAGGSGHSGNGHASGIARVYTIENDEWVQMGQDIYGLGADDWLGRSIALSANGMVVAAGADGGDINGDRTGDVRAFEYNGTAWNQMGQTLSGRAAKDKFGTSISLSADGETMAVGAERADSAQGNISNVGRVRAFHFNRTIRQWAEHGQPLFGVARGDRFGYSIDLSSDGTVLAVGSYLYDDARIGNEAGIVNVFQNNGTLWNQMGPPIVGEVAGDWFGVSVTLSIAGENIVLAAGASLHDGIGGMNSGNVRLFVYSVQDKQWVATTRSIEGESSGDGFGSRVVLSKSSNVLAAGAYQHNQDTGQVQLFRIDNDIFGEM